MNLTIKESHGASAVISTHGAELRGFSSGGYDYLWNGDPAYWAGVSPFLFPFPSNLRNGTTYFNGKPYCMDAHGFARNYEWTVEKAEGNTAVLTFSQNEETLQLYPFRFTLRATYTVLEDSVSLTMEVKNDGDGEMPYCFGTHPAIRVPFQNSPGSRFEDYELKFEKPEENSCPLYDEKAGQIDVNARRPFLSDSQTLPLRYSDYDEVDTIIFDHLNSGWVDLRDRNTGRSVRVSFTPFDYIAFWTPHAPFLCIEPWQGLSACSDEDDDFRHKRGCRILQPGQSETYTLTISVK